MDRMRTAFPGSAHVEYARGIDNPIGMKVGPGMDTDRLLKLMISLTLKTFQAADTDSTDLANLTLQQAFLP